MIWHIFRKDLKLLWRMVIGVALINLMQRVNLSSAGPFFRAEMSPHVMLSGVLGFVGLLATGALIVMAVQADSIPGSRQDWLVRPIRRRDLLLSKILFVALMVQGPILLIEVGQCLAAGFPIGPSLAAPLSRSVWMFLAMDLPVLAFATLTRNLSQAAGAAIAVFLVWTLFTGATLFYLNFSFDNIWIRDSVQAAWGLAGVVIVVALQYYRRKTARARWVYGVAALIWLFVQFLPWQPAFAIEKHLSPRAAVADGIQIVFDPTLGKLRGRSPIGSHSRGLPTADVHLFIPLRETGAAEGQILVVDRMSPRIRRSGGKDVRLGDVLRSRFIESLGYEVVWVPQDIYRRWKDQLAALEIEYSLTVLEADKASAIPAVSGDQWIDNIGRCSTRTSATGAEGELGCLSPGDMPCFTFSLEFSGTGSRSDRAGDCQSNFAPYVDRVNGDSISRFARGFPIEGTQLKNAQVVLTPYHPEAHFTRQVVIPSTRLSDWWVE